MTVQDHAKRLDDAALNRAAIAQLSVECPGLSVESAYEIQRALIARRIARGENAVGVKLGFTSKAKIAQMGVDDLIWGHLTSDMWTPDGADVNLDQFIHPRVEPEVAFLIGRDIGIDSSAAEAIASVDAIAPAIELIDSRYADFRFNVADVVADNASSSRFVVGPWRKPDVDLSNLGMLLKIRGRVMQTGSSAAILGNPWRSVSEAARLTSSAGESLKAGFVIMAGGATAAEAITEPSEVNVHVSGLGSASVTLRR